MKVRMIRVPLEYIRGAVPADYFEITGPTLRASDGHWSAEATLPKPISARMTLPFSKFLSIVRTLDDDDDIKIELNGTTCRVKAEDTLWELSLLNQSVEPTPEFQRINTIEVAGHLLFEARKSLKHLILPWLARPGLMWAGTNEDHELVIGNGTSLGGHSIGIKGLELPNMVLSEIWRILGVSQSEMVTFDMGETQIRATTWNGYFQAALPNGRRFETDWYHKVRNLLNEDPQVIRTSRSELLYAINQVKITAYDSTAELALANGNLLLASKDEYGDKSTTKIEAYGILKEPLSLNIDHLEAAVEVLTGEMIILTVCKSAVEVSDPTGWEIIPRIQQFPNPKVKEKNAYDTSKPQGS